jgi:outer membrane protein assembly factor BamB
MGAGELRRLMAGLAEALRDIHRVGVVHRDLKPSNVLLADDGPKVIDFGISRPTDSELRTETGKLIGTPPFMAPEQFRRPREVGPAADVFALGSVLVHAATGRGPFDSDSPYVVAYQVVHDEPDLAGVPDELAPLILRCLAKEPEERPTPDELMRELRSVAASYDTQVFIPAQRAGDPSEPKPQVTEPERTEKRRRRGNGRTVLGVGAVGLAVVAALAAVQLNGGDSTVPKTDRAHRTTSAGFGPWATPGPWSGEDGTPRCSHGAGRLLCAQAGHVFALDPSDGRLLWRHAVARSEGSRVPAVAGGLVQALSARGGRLEALDPVSGRTVWQREVPASGGLEPAGDTLLLTGADGTVTGVDGASGETRWSHRVPGHRAPRFVFFAGDSLAYATSPSADGSGTRVTAVDPGTGDVRWDTRLEGELEPVGTNGETVFLTSADRVYGDTEAVVAYHPGTGTTRRAALPATLEQGHGTAHGNVVHLMGSGGSLVAVDMKARKQLWSVETGLVRGSAPVSDGRHVYVTAPDGRLLAMEASTGRPVGQTAPRPGAAGRVAAALPRPVIAHGHVHASAPDGTVFAVDGRDPGAW